MKATGVQGERNILLDTLYENEKEPEKDEYFKTASFKAALNDEKENKVESLEIKHLQDVSTPLNR